jgi:hypothetical protein
MAITGTHTLLYSSEPEKLRATLRDVFGLPGIDIGDGWWILALPPSEVAVHPAGGPTFESGVRHQFTFMCDNITSTVRDLRAKGIEVMNTPQEERWGIHVTCNLPGNCQVMVYEPKHAIAAGMRNTKNPTRTKNTKKNAAKKATSRPGRRARKAPRRR